ncbi:related to YOS1, subunit of the Yip1p-Yif1p Complex, required for Transport between the ER and th [Cephalotrichum gorgonifer]|uniref:Related to YOS1, subunit of the Yip1p-Yif1p Complex, required for Transport between the ER and th n=1 Tax=Cephalotrichum gorgonifer TaxID=2041049 RepID=A0AAE8SQZ5_9PEZI|nr:related to YOS1, subunit of the Yip1p-Yif1p Complex, required for Transport between the ER and th [Cephalotrichum gorgonifer]
MFFLGSFIYVAVLLTNAVAILSEDRFLARINLSSSSYDPAFGAGHDPGVTGSLVKLIASIRTVARVPLIGANLAIILYELILG